MNTYKKYFLAVAVVSIVGVMILNIQLDVYKSRSEMKLANIQALANENSGNSIPCYGTVRLEKKDPNKYEPVWNTTNKSVSKITLANIQALTKENNGGSIPCYGAVRITLLKFPTLVLVACDLRCIFVKRRYTGL